MAKKKTWIYFKTGLFRDPKHRREMSESVWLYGYIIDHADWDTGVMDEFKDQECADEMEASLSWVRKHRRKLESQGYITSEQRGQLGQRLTITKWINPRSYDGKVLNDTGQSVTNVTPSPKSQSVTQSGTQSVTQSSTNGSLNQAQTEHASIESVDHKINKDSGASAPIVLEKPQDKPKKKRAPNLLFDAVALGSFGISDSSQIDGNGGRITPIVEWLKENDPNTSPDRVKEFYDWYHSEYKGAAEPRNLEKFKEHYRKFREEAAKQYSIPSAYKIGPDGNIDWERKYT